jgi:hypothetical protein
VMRIDYANYKDHMESTRGHDFTDALHRVWTAMQQVEDAEARG